MVPLNNPRWKNIAKKSCECNLVLKISRNQRDAFFSFSHCPPRSLVWITKLSWLSDQALKATITSAEVIIAEYNTTFDQGQREDFYNPHCSVCATTGALIALLFTFTFIFVSFLFI